MRYENRLPEEGTNTPKRHPLRELGRLLLFAALACAIAITALNFIGGRLGALIPFPVELWVTKKVDRVIIASGQVSPFTVDQFEPELQEYLVDLTKRVTDALELESSMAISLHYQPDDTINAFATVGGHVYMHRGLLRLLPHENALAMLIAHEVSHVSLRHTAKGIGSGLAVAIGTSLLPAGTGLQERLYSLGSNVTQMSFSRRMESEADANALRAVNTIYGHINGANELFELFAAQRGNDSNKRWDNFLQTHPLDDERIEALAAQAKENRWAENGKLTNLPDKFDSWLE